MRGTTKTTHYIHSIGAVLLLTFATHLLGPEKKGAGAQDTGTIERAGEAVVGASVAVPED